MCIDGFSIYRRLFEMPLRPEYHAPADFTDKLRMA
jgi:hypothetical protein